MKVSGAVAMADHVEAFGLADLAVEFEASRPRVLFDADPFTPSEADIERVANAIGDAMCDQDGWLKKSYSEDDMLDIARVAVKALNAP